MFLIVFCCKLPFYALRLPVYFSAVGPEGEFPSNASTLFQKHKGTPPTGQMPFKVPVTDERDSFPRQDPRHGLIIIIYHMFGIRLLFIRFSRGRIISLAKQIPRTPTNMVYYVTLPLFIPWYQYFLYE